jgi:alkylation response protein AidB-like acyl-CoA dehydrogenase
MLHKVGGLRQHPPEQFKLPIAKFGAIKHKLAEQAIRIYAIESAIYRVSNLIEQQRTGVDGQRA